MVAAAAVLAVQPSKSAAAQAGFSSPAKRLRVLGTAGDLTVAMILAFGSAAAGSRLLWPVLLIAGYYAIGVLLTGTSPMVALLSDQAAAEPPAPAREPVPAPGPNRPAPERRHQPRRTNERPRQRRGAQQVRAQ